jgi:glycosyltransferase involved in cell wall biosynthesis
MTVTISIMCYNYGQYLGRAIESGLNQQGHDFDVNVLVIDDGSTDNTPQVCEEYADHIRVLRSENQGFGASLTRAIRQAQGDYVCLLDADDYFVETKLQEIEPFIQHGYDLIVHKSYLIDETESLLREKPKGGGSTSNLCIHREKALDLLPVQNEISFHALKHLGESIDIDRPLAYYRVHDESMTQSHAKQYDYLASVTHRLADHLKGMAEQPPDWTDEVSLVEASRIFRTTASYDEMEAELLRGKYLKALRKCATMLRHATTTPEGVGIWHLKLAARCLQGRAIEPPSQSKYREGDL